VIACECLIGYKVPEGGDPFDGCIPQSESSGTSRGGGAAPPSPSPPTTPPPPTTESTLSPLSTLGSIIRESNEDASPVPRAIDTVDTDDTIDIVVTNDTATDDSRKRLQAGHRPGQLVPRRKTKPNVVYEDVDTKELFPDECLVHEDCEEKDFCSPPPENKCVDACTLDVCGDGAVCISALHRPVCSCPEVGGQCL